MQIRIEVGWEELGTDLQDDLVQEIAIETGMNTKWVRDLLEQDYMRGGFCGELTMYMEKIIG